MSAPTRAPNIARKSLLVSLVFAFFTVLLIWTEIWIGVAAAAWSLAAVLHFGTVGYMLVAVIAGPVALWASWMSLKLAWQSERNGDYA